MPHPNNTKYIPGDHWVECDVCGLEYRASQMLERWDGKLVCEEDWEPRHPQESIRARKDDTSAKGHVRPEPTDTFTTGACTSRSAVAGVAVAGCALAGWDNVDIAIPSGTFTNGL